MPLPALAMLGISAAPAIGAAAYKFISGNKQVKDGKRIAKNNKFVNYQRPSEVTQALNLAERNLTNGMPGSDILQNRIGSNAATAMTAAREGSSSSGDVLDAATKIGMGTNRAMQDLSLQEQNFEQNALRGYTDQLDNSAGYADKEFNYNIAQPYQRNAAAASGLIGAGSMNKWSGVDDFGGVATDAIRTGLGMPKEPTMGDIMGNPEVSMAGMVGMSGINNNPLAMNQPLTMGTKYGNAISPSAQSVGVKQAAAGFSNPSLMGKWIVDPNTGSKRWSINGI